MAIQVVRERCCGTTRLRFVLVFASLHGDGVQDSLACASCLHEVWLRGEVVVEPLACASCL